jgi:hypothetical protein
MHISFFLKFPVANSPLHTELTISNNFGAHVGWQDWQGMDFGVGGKDDEMKMMSDGHFQRLFRSTFCSIRHRRGIYAYTKSEIPSVLYSFMSL